MTQKKLIDLYTYFDSLFDEDDNQDLLFASSYVRGFIAVAAVEFGDDEQVLSSRLYQQVAEKIQQARTELSPQDRKIVNDFYQHLAIFF